MNLSEKLNLNYCDTTAVAEQIKQHLERAKQAEHQRINLDKWASLESPFYVALTAIKAAQDAHKIVTDDEYRSIPNCGMAYYWSAADGYFLVNFHYNFFYSNYKDKIDLLDKFMDFLAVVDFTECKESEVYNWARAYSHFRDHLKSSRPDLAEKCDFISQILEAIDPVPKKHNGIGSLSNIDRSIAPDIFDNAVRYFKAKESHYTNNH